jgi:hypothetical protein
VGTRQWLPRRPSRGRVLYAVELVLKRFLRVLTLWWLSPIPATSSASGATLTPLLVLQEANAAPSIFR